jgi:hypothetical protein
MNQPSSNGSLSKLKSQQSNTKSLSTEANENLEYSKNIKNKQYSQKPIGIYSFKSNNSDFSSLEESVDEIVSSFIEENKDNIIKYVVSEVENKLKEKIQPLNAEINSIKNNFNGLYEEEINDFKQLNILNQCHNNILNINDNVNIMKENIDKYDNEIKGFNISDNKLKFLNKLNKDLQEFIDGLNNDKDMMMDLDTDEENTKIDSEVKKMNNINQELNIVFYDTLSLLKDISKDEKKDNMNYDDDILNNLKNVINNPQNKLNFEKTFKDDTINNNIDSDCKYNPLDSIPNFFE